MSTAAQINLYDYLQKPTANKISGSNLSGYDFELYDSLVDFGFSSHGNSEEEEKRKTESFHFLTKYFLRMFLENQTKSSEATSPTSTEFDRASDSHTGEISRARAIERIIELQECAQEEQIPINARSQWDLLKFISGYTSTDDLNIFLLDGGTFRVIWKTSAHQLGLEFLGNGTLKKTVIVGNLNTGEYSASSELGTLQLNSGF